MSSPPGSNQLSSLVELSDITDQNGILTQLFDISPPPFPEITSTPTSTPTSTFDLTAPDLGTQIRMQSNQVQRVTAGAEPPPPSNAVATVIDNSQQAGGIDPRANDWRVSLSVPTYFRNSPLFVPFAKTSNRMVFPLNPTIILGNSASYSEITPTHTNYPYYAYQSSKIDNINVVGEYLTQNATDAQYWIAVLHFLRTMTKMFYGGGEFSGTPPLITRLNGYGRHVLNNIPCVVSLFSVNLPNDVDYIKVRINGVDDYVPVRSEVSVTLQPQYSRVSQSKFDLNKFANGDYSTNDPNQLGFI